MSRNRIGISSLTNEPGVAMALHDGAERDGSNTGFLFIDKLAWQKRDAAHTLIVGARQIIELKALVPYRLRFGRELRLAGRDSWIQLKPGPTVTIQVADGALDVTLDAAQNLLLDTVQPRAGIYRLSAQPELLLEVRKTEIKDAEGRVVETIG